MKRRHESLPEDIVGLAKVLNDDRYMRKELSYGTWYNHDRSIQRFSNFLQSSTGSAYVLLREFSLDMFSNYLSSCTGVSNARALVANCTPLLNAFAYAGKNEMIDHVKAARVFELVDERAELLTANDPSPEYLKENHIDKLKSYWQNLVPGSEKDYLDMFFFSLHAYGIGFSHIMSLEWRQVDFEAGYITVNGKNHGSARCISLDGTSREILERWKSNGRNKRFVFNLLDPGFKPVLVDQLQEIHASKNKTLNMSLAASFKSAGIEGKISFQMARHTFVAAALKDGVPIDDISRMVGHRSVKTTRRTYRKMIDEICSQRQERTLSRRM